MWKRRKRWRTVASEDRGVMSRRAEFFIEAVSLRPNGEYVVTAEVGFKGKEPEVVELRVGSGIEVDLKADIVLLALEDPRGS